MDYFSDIGPERNKHSSRIREVLVNFSVKFAAGILLLLVLSSTLAAQDLPVNCSRFRLLLPDGRNVTGKDGVLLNGMFTGTTQDGIAVNLKVEEIRSIDRRVGTKARQGALIGACLGALIAIIAVVQINGDPDKGDDRGKFPALAAGFIGGGVLLGATIGSTSPRWEHVMYRKPMGSIDGRSVHLTLGVRF